MEVRSTSAGANGYLTTMEDPTWNFAGEVVGLESLVAAGGRIQAVAEAPGVVSHDPGTQGPQTDPGTVSAPG